MATPWRSTENGRDDVAKPGREQGGARVCVLFHYFERDAIYRDNLICFLALAVQARVDLHVLIAGECSVRLPELPNLTIHRVENINLDHGGYAQGLERIGAGIGRYDAVIFVNSSVRGPFLPPGFGGQWTELFTGRLQGEVHLVGSSINILEAVPPYARMLAEEHGYPPPYSHVQTTAYALSREALAHLIEIGFYACNAPMPKHELIARYELRLSQEIRRQGWNMRCLLPAYDGIDYRQPHRDMNFSSVMGDPLGAGRYFGRTPHPTELVFVKTNRDLLDATSLASHSYTALAASGDGPLSDWPERRDLLNRSEARLRAAAAAAAAPTARRIWRRIRRIAPGKFSRGA